ncbi:MAG: hypothetical protein H0X33_14615 [Taibaiella sp.]|nr:hypothetical protein [Taibaiella sp.]
MQTVKESDIDPSDFTVSGIHHARHWYRELNYILNNEDLNNKVQIIFETRNGTRKVETTIVDIIENYVKIDGGVIIPMSSISEIYFKDQAIKIPTGSLVFRIIASIILVVLFIALFLLIYK